MAFSISLGGGAPLRFLRSVSEGVFDICTLASLAGEPGYGQPRPGCRGQRLLFD